MKIDSNIEKLLPFMIEHRRALHKIPELCYDEVKTSAYLQRILTELGYEFKTVGTGVIVNIKGSDGKKTMGFRADMDALAVEEQTGCDYSSKHKGVMHACGHDGHMAMLLGFAKYLVKNPPRNNIVLVFQPAEEGGLGSKIMIESGYVNADVFYALHVNTELETGKFLSIEGPSCAGADTFDIIFTGKGRHAKHHNGTQDAILASAVFITEAEKINKSDLLFNIGKIEGGSVSNAVADKVTLTGTIRFFDVKEYEFAHKKIDEIFEMLEKNNVGTGRLVQTEALYMPVINTPEAVAVLRKIDGFVQGKKGFGAEDFGLFIEKFTGAFIHLGAKNKDAHPLHSCYFNFDENAMKYGVQIFKELSELY